MKEVKKKTLADWLLYPLRIVTILSAAGLFLPALNPARMSLLINKNMSLFTSALFYDRLTSEFIRPLSKGWIQESTLKLTLVLSLIALIGICVSGAGMCMSLGEIKLKKLGVFVSIFGYIMTAASLLGFFETYDQFCNAANAEKIKPDFAGGVYFFLILALIGLVLSVASFLLLPKPQKDDKYEMQSQYKLFLMAMPFLALAFVFSYLPLYGWRIVFYDYSAGKALSECDFVGLRKFVYLFENEATRDRVGVVMINTLVMSGLGLLTSWCAMAFAVFLVEIRNMRYRRIVQTLTTIPNFLSWVLVYAFAIAIFESEGFINSLLIELGIYDTPRLFLQEAQGTHVKMLLWGMWKGLGWSAIIYIAAITGIDQEMYEAATVDGAGRFRKMWNITIPSILPTYFVLLLLSIAGILSNGMDQYLVFSNAMNKEQIEVLDLYVYNLGLNGGGDLSLATVVGMCKSVISVVLLFVANSASKALRGESIV